MSGPSNANDTLITDYRQLVEVMASGEQPIEDWRIGTEHEKFGFRLDDLRPPEFDGERGIEALLALARFESGQEAPQTDPLELGALLRQLVQDQRQTRDHIQLVFPAEAWVVCDAGMLERIVANLLHNAVEYGDADAPVSVRLWRDGDWWLEVRNRASQLHTDDVAHFGERHWRGQRDGDPQHAGLGLALVLAMTHALGMQVAFFLQEDTLAARLGPLPAI